MAMAIKNPGPVVERFKAVAEKAVADGASVIIPKPGLLPPLIYKEGVTSINGATILDPICVAAKFAEMLADLQKIGIGFSRKLGVYGTPDKEMRKEILERYSKVFKIET